MEIVTVIQWKIDVNCSRADYYSYNFFLWAGPAGIRFLFERQKEEERGREGRERGREREIGVE